MARYTTLRIADRNEQVQQYKRATSEYLRDEINRVCDEWGVSKKLLSTMSEHKCGRYYRLTDANKQVAFRFQELEQQYGRDICERTCEYVWGIMNTIIDARENYAGDYSKFVQGRFEKKPRLTLKEYLKANQYAAERVFEELFKRYSFTNNGSYYAPKGDITRLGSLTACPKTLLVNTKAQFRDCVERYHEVSEIHDHPAFSRKFVYEEEEDASWHRLWGKNSQGKPIELNILRVSPTFTLRREHDMQTIRISGRDYVITQAKQIDHPYVQEEDRTCWEAHVVSVLNEKLVYKTGYIVAHNGVSEVTKAFGDTAKAASQLLERRLVKSIKDTLLDDF